MPQILGLIKKDFLKFSQDQTAFDDPENTVLSRVIKEAVSKIKPIKSENLPGNMVLIIAVFDLLKSSLFKNKIIMKELIIFIGFILENCNTNEYEAMNELRNYTLLILEKL